MTNDELRRLAEAAKPQCDYHPNMTYEAVERSPDDEHYVEAVILFDDNDYAAEVYGHCSYEVDGMALAKYWAAASPDAVLKLLDENERLKKDFKELDKQYGYALQRIDELDELESTILDLFPDYEDESFVEIVRDLDKRIHELALEGADMVGEIELLRGLLKRCEWSGYGEFCPLCHRLKHDGHAPDCELAQALRGEG